jgi:hypothetical protein
MWQVKIKEDKCRNQTPLKFLIYLENFFSWVEDIGFTLDFCLLSQISKIPTTPAIEFG